MQGDFNENSGYTGFQDNPPEKAGPEYTPQNTIEPFDQYISAGIPVEQPAAPIERSSAPTDQTVVLTDHSAAPTEHPVEQAADNPVPPQQQYGNQFRDSFVDRFYIPHANEWQEPVYSQTQDPMNNMYTPGIYANQDYYRKHNAQNRQKREERKHSGRAGRFLRTVCVVVLCVVLSGASAYGVFEYRLQRGDLGPAVSNQVVLGGTRNPPSSSVLSPIVTGGNSMPAEDIYIQSRDHVVGINTETDASNNVPGMQSSSGTTTVASGSGFIISSDGYILTNYHVIETAYVNNLSLMVYLSDGTSYKAQVIGYESSSDIAIIKIDATGLNPAVIGDSDNIKVGQTVYAVGNPFGDLTYTMTDGIISALDRVVTVDQKSIDTFQFSAAVNPGNSGGPVYNTDGEVVGIVTAKFMQDSVEGIGFAIPINSCIEIASELIEHGYISGRPLLGITVETANSGLSDFYDWGVVGAYVKSVNPGSAAEKAGIAVGDIIVALDGTEIDSSNTLIYTLRKYRANDTANITVWRNGEKIDLTITFDENLTAGQPQQPQVQPITPDQQTPQPNAPDQQQPPQSSAPSQRPQRPQQPQPSQQPAEPSAS